MGVMKIGWKQSVASAGVLVAMLLLLVSIDPRVREHMSSVVSPGGASTMGHGAMDLASVLVSAVKHQSIENSPLVIFAVVGAILVLFMLKV
jgi:hypothetical protein